MKKLIVLLAAAAIICGANLTASAQVNSGLVSQFTNAAAASQDSQLGSIASELTGKMQTLGTSAGTNSATTGQLNSTLKSLSGGQDSAALGSAFDLVKGAKLTPDQVGVAKQVGNLASAYVVQKNFATLPGSQGDVATIVTSLRGGNLTSCVAPLKNVAGNANLTDGQKQLVSTVANKYAPGWQKAQGAMDAIKKLPGF